MATNPPGVPTARLKLQIKASPESTLVTCRGRLTADIAAEFKQEVRALVPQTKHLVIDLGEVPFMDSSGLGALIAVYVSAKKAACEFQLVNVSKKIGDLLGVTHMLSILETTAQYGARMF